MQNAMTMTSSALDNIDETRELLESTGGISRYAKTVEMVSEFASDHPVATVAIAGVAAVGVGYLAYKGISKLVGSGASSEENNGDE